jgi:uncharacterized protein YuzE
MSEQEIIQVEAAPIFKRNLRNLITYEPKVDIWRILFSEAPIEESDEEKQGVTFDYDINGNIVGLEILDA